MPPTEITDANRAIFIAKAIRIVSQDPKLRDRWMTGLVLCALIKSRYLFQGKLDFDAHAMNQAVTAKFPNVDERIDVPGQVFRLFKSLHGKRHAFYYFGETRGTIPKGKKDLAAWRNKEAWHEFAKQADTFDRELSRSIRRAENNNSNKRQRISDDLDDLLAAARAAQEPDKAAAAASVATAPNATDPALFQFFDSTEASNLFKTQEGDVNAEETIKRRIELLADAINIPDGYKRVIPPPGDPANAYSEVARMSIRQRSMMLYCAYTKALELMPGGANFTACCELAAIQLRQVGITACPSTASMQTRNREFRTNECFPHHVSFLKQKEQSSAL